MLNSTEKNILKLIRYLPIVFVLLIAIINISLLVFENNKRLDSIASHVREDVYASLKKDIKIQADSLYKYIQYQNKNDEEIKVDMLKNIAYLKDSFIISKGELIVFDKKNKHNKKFLESIRETLDKHKEKFAFYNIQKKVFYLIYFKEKDCLIGSSFDSSRIDEDILPIIKKLSLEYNDYLLNIIFLNLFISLLVIISSIFISNKISAKFLEYTSKVHNQMEKNREKDYILSQQSKMAAMGEMIGNIAHQWRQPLSLISTASSALKLKQELGDLSKEDVIETSDRILNASKHLSNTIDDFRNFFRPNKEKILVNTNELWLKIESLIKSQYESKNIKIITNIESLEFKTIENELIQVFLNILNNARDELDKKEDEEGKFIFITMLKEKDLLNISIKDTAGGIPEDIINRIFEPYFTTKHKSVGTGIGLYMSDEIIRKHIKGNIKVSNEDFVYKENSYKGALFEIEIPF